MGAIRLAAFLSNPFVELMCVTLNIFSFFFLPLKQCYIKAMPQTWQPNMLLLFLQGIGQTNTCRKVSLDLSESIQQSASLSG